MVSILPNWPSKSNVLGQSYCTFPIGKSLVVYSNAPAFKELMVDQFQIVISSSDDYHFLQDKIKYTQANDWILFISL